MFHFKPLDLERASKLVALARDIAAVLFIPFSCLYAAGLVLILWQGHWPEATAPQRIQFLGIALLGMLVLVALGMLWLQRRDIPKIKASWVGGKLELEADDGERVKEDGDV